MPDAHIPEYTVELTPDLSYVFEAVTPAGTRLVTVVLPEDVDEITGPRPPEPTDEQKKRRRQAARLLAEPELVRMWQEAMAKETGG